MLKFVFSIMLHPSLYLIEVQILLPKLIIFPPCELISILSFALGKHCGVICIFLNSFSPILAM